MREDEERDTVLQGLAAAPALVPPALRLPAGTRLGPYEVRGVLGAGGMGAVYRAHDVRLGRDVAVKVLRHIAYARSAWQARFEREARAVAAISHPNVMALHDVGVHAGMPYLVCELLEGRTLREELEAGPLPGALALRFAVQIARGLAAAHEKGLVHRDLKPANVFIAAGETVKILDFGLAKSVALADLGDDASPGVVARALETERGTVIGTVGYMAPEQVRGEPADHRADLFAFGVVLHEMLTGRRPVALTTVPLPAGTPDGVERVVRRCLAERPDERFQSVTELLSVLEAFGDEAALRSGSRRNLRRPVAGAVVLCGALTWFLVGRDRQPPADPAAPSIGVLPFTDLSPARDQEYFSEGVAEAILTSLARVDGLHVAGRTSSFSFKGGTDDPRTIGRELNVSTILGGAVRKDGQRLRISVRLLNATDGYQLWSMELERELGDVFAMEDEIARDVVAALPVRLAAGVRSASDRRRTRSLAAYDEYLLARRLSADNSTESLTAAIEAVERALRKDPAYAAAWALDSRLELAMVYADVPRSQGLPLLQRAETAAAQAIALDPSLPDGYLSRMALRISGYRDQLDLAGARADVKRALELDPNDPEAVAALAELLMSFFPDELAEAIAAARRSVELDPLSSRAWMWLGLGYRAARRFEDERQALTRALQISPKNVMASAMLGLNEFHRGHFAEALDRFDGFPPGELRLTGRTVALAALGRTEESRVELAALETQYADENPCFVGEAYALLGDLDSAFPYFERGLEKRDVAMLRDLITHPSFDALRRDPRYVELMRKMGVPAQPPP